MRGKGAIEAPFFFLFSAHSYIIENDDILPAFDLFRFVDFVNGKGFQSLPGSGQFFHDYLSLVKNSVDPAKKSARKMLA